jgi:uncharacterized membrane protein
MSTKFADDTITTARLISFSDGVFAIAVTLLVFNLKVPEIPAANVHVLLPDMIQAMLPHFTVYVLSFLLIAVYWTFHHRMLNLVTRMDTPFLWMNICYLLVIAFIPFPTALFGAYPHETLSFVFYICSLMLVGFLSMLMLWYASHNHRLVSKELPVLVVKYLFFRQFTSLIVFLLAIPLAFYQLRWAQYYLFILFPVHWLARKYFRKYSEKVN